MDRKFLNLPKVFAELAEKSDQVIRDNARPPPQVQEWFQIIIETARKIADGEFVPRKSSSTSGSSKDLLEFSPSSVPSCLQLVKGEAETHATRVSSYFPLQERDHLHRKKSVNVNGKKTSSENGTRSSIHVNGKKINLLKVENGSGSNYIDENSRTPPRKASTRGKKSSSKAESGKANSTGAGNSPTSSKRASTRGKKNSAKSENGFDSTNFMTPKNASARGKENTPKVETDSDVYIVAEKFQPATPINSGLDRTFVKPNSDSKFATPVRRSKGTPLNQKSKRKSSRNLSKMTSLEQEMFQKKLKGLSSNSNKPNLVTRSSRFSMGKKKFSGLKETHQPSALAGRCSSKASGTGKKETLQYKENIAAENLKKLQDARQKKIEEKKRLRDEKMERTKEKRMNLEKTKAHCGKPKTTEPITRSTRAQDRSAERITRSKEPRGESMSDAIQPILKVKASQANSQQKTARSESKKTTPPLKTPLKSSQTNSKQKAAKSEIKNITPPKRTQASSKTRTPTPPLKTPLPHGTPASSRGRRPTPPMKTQPLKVTPNPTVISLQNTTVSLSKEPGSHGPLKRTVTPTSPSSKANSKLTESISTSGQKMAESSSPSNSKKPKLEVPASGPKTPTAAKKPDSYELTPDRSSFTSYDMSEIVSDDDDEDTSGTTKPVPSWALGLRLRNALIHQYYNPVNTDELFGNACEVPDLEQMFDVKKKAYSKRTSSAIWQSPRTFR